MGTEVKKGSRLLKIIGIIAVIGILIAAGRIVLRVFSEKSVTGESQEGV